MVFHYNFNVVIGPYIYHLPLQDPNIGVRVENMLRKRPCGHPVMVMIDDKKYYFYPNEFDMGDRIQNLIREKQKELLYDMMKGTNIQVELEEPITVKVEAFKS